MHLRRTWLQALLEIYVCFCFGNLATWIWIDTRLGTRLGTYFKNKVQAWFSAVTLDLVATYELVTQRQRPFFKLLHKIIQFSDIMQISDSFCWDQKCHYIDIALYLFSLPTWPCKKYGHLSVSTILHFGFDASVELWCKDLIKCGKGSRWLHKPLCRNKDKQIYPQPLSNLREYLFHLSTLQKKVWPPLSLLYSRLRIWHLSSFINSTSAACFWAGKSEWTVCILYKLGPN